MTDINATAKHVAVGDIVLYTLSTSDCNQIIHNRHVAGQSTKRGNAPRPGDVVPAIVVKSWGDGNSLNLQVTLDGDDTLWAPSRERFAALVENAEPRGHWVAR